MFSSASILAPKPHLLTYTPISRVINHLDNAYENPIHTITNSLLFKVCLFTTDTFTCSYSNQITEYTNLPMCGLTKDCSCASV